MSQEQAPIAAVLADAAAEIGAVGKGRRTESGARFQYRGVDDVVNAVADPLHSRGVVVVPEVLAWSAEDVVVGSKQTPMRSVTVHVRYRFHGPAGDSLDCSALGEAMDSGDKATSKAMSVAYRTALLQALTLPTDERDPDEDQYERAGRHSGHPVEPSPADVVAEQKRRLVEACSGDVDAAKSLWGDRTDPLSEDELDELLTEARQRT